MFSLEMHSGKDMYGWNCKEPEDVYDRLIEEVGHKEALEVQKWCYLASIGDICKGNLYTVRVLED